MRPWVLLGAFFLLGSACGRGSPEPRAVPTAAPALRAITAQGILERVREPGARAVVVNVWASWCTPCREEFPDLLELEQEYRTRGLRLVLVSADFADQAEEARHFLTTQGVDFPTFLKTGKDMEFINGLDSRWSGALPATFVYDGRGTLRSFHEGRTTHAALESLVVAAMSPHDSIRKETVR